MRFYPRQHAFYCGVDLHARTMQSTSLTRPARHLYVTSFLPDPSDFWLLSGPTAINWSSASVREEPICMRQRD